MLTTNRDRSLIHPQDLELLSTTTPDCLEEIMDPLTGELVPTVERDRMRELHGKLEEVALELLATCRQIRAAIGDHEKVSPRLMLWSPGMSPLCTSEETIP